MPCTASSQLLLFNTAAGLDASDRSVTACPGFMTCSTTDAAQHATQLVVEAVQSVQDISVHDQRNCRSASAGAGMFCYSAGWPQDLPQTM